MRMLNIVLRIMMIWRTLLSTEWPGSDVEDANKEENKNIFSTEVWVHLLSPASTLTSYYSEKPFTCYLFKFKNGTPIAACFFFFMKWEN